MQLPFNEKQFNQFNQLRELKFDRVLILIKNTKLIEDRETYEKIIEELGTGFNRTIIQDINYSSVVECFDELSNEDLEELLSSYYSELFMGPNGEGFFINSLD